MAVFQGQIDCPFIQVNLRARKEVVEVHRIARPLRLGRDHLTSHDWLTSDIFHQEHFLTASTSRKGF